MPYADGDYRKQKAWGGGNTTVKRLRHWSPKVRALGNSDGPLAQVADEMIEAANKIDWLERQMRKLARANLQLRRK